MGVGTAIGAAGIAGAGASLGGAAMGAGAAGDAASAQANAAEYAAQLQHEDAQAALNFQKQEWNTQQQNIAPWLKVGQGAIGSLWNMYQNGGFPNWTEQFTAPTDVTEQNDPGYKFRLNQGLTALENSAAARGGVLSGGTMKAEQQYAQDYASNEYSNVYNRAMQEYLNRYNIFEQNQSNQFNRLTALSGVGQTATGQLGSFGQGAANNMASILLNSGQMIGQDYQNAAAARASGYIGGANAWSGALGGMTNNLSNLYMMYQLMNQGGGNTALPMWGG